MGIGTSIFLMAVGAILDYAVDVRTSGVNLHTVGLILMLVGLVGLLFSLIYWSSWGGWGFNRRDVIVHHDALPRRRVVEEEVPARRVRRVVEEEDVR